MRLSAQALNYIAARIYSCRIGKSPAGRPVEPNSYASTSSARRGFINVLKVGVAGTYCKEGLDRNLLLDRNPISFLHESLAHHSLDHRKLPNGYSILQLFFLSRILIGLSLIAPNRATPRVLPRGSSTGYNRSAARLL